MGTNKRNRFDVSPYLFISPVFILLALLVVYPIAYAFYLSVMDTNLTTKWEFVGLSNYISLLKDGSMINSLKVTFLFTIVQTMRKAMDQMVKNLFAMWIFQKMFGRHLNY